MVRLLTIVIVGLSVISYDAYAFSLADSVLTEDLKFAGENDATALSQQLLNKQASYMISHGNYWQGLPLFGSVPSSPAAPDGLRDKPDDVDIDWVDFGIIAGSLTRYNQRVNTYQTPTCHGYVLVTEVESYDGVIYEKSQNVGCDTSRDENWHISPLMYDGT